MKILWVSLLLMISFSSIADWHTGKLKFLGVGYDGATIALSPEGWDRNDCTCYPTWPSHMCLIPSRASYEFEKSLVLSARARGSVLKIHVDETTCSVLAIYENDN